MSNFVPNFEWKRTFWKNQTDAKTTYILASKGKKSVQRPTQLWVMGKIDQAYLGFAEDASFQTWTLKLILDPNQQSIVEAGLRNHGLFKGEV